MNRYLDDAQPRLEQAVGARGLIHAALLSMAFWVAAGYVVYLLN
jgi:hypothetical protein